MIKSEFALLPYMFLLVVSSCFIADTQYLLSLLSGQLSQCLGLSGLMEIWIMQGHDWL